MFDLLIRNAEIVNGAGGPAYRADAAVVAGRITDIGTIPPDAQARETVEAQGLTLAPGFIDIHTHADISLLARPDHLPKVMQGVTTEVFTNCGLGFAPVTGDALRTQREYLGGLFGPDEGVDWQWSSVAEFLKHYERRKCATNVAYLIPHGAVRVSIMGMAARPADSGELDAMAHMVLESMEQGAWGLSTGLWYAPMCHADRAENVAVCRAAGFFATHQRAYDADVIPATEETIAIAEEAGVPVQLSHLQLNGPAIGTANQVLGLLDRARARGVDVTWDSYPYAAGSTFVQSLLPAWANDGGPRQILNRLRDLETVNRIEDELNTASRDWSRTMLAGAQSQANRPLEGLSFSHAAETRGLSVPQFIVRLLIEDELQACYISHSQDEGDVRAIFAHHAQMVGSDGLHLAGKTHPRLYGTFPRILAKYARDEKILDLSEAVRKMTSAPADRIGLKDRGRIATGMAADLVLFDPKGVRDTATFEDPLQFPEGIPHVWVNGIAVKRDGQPTHALPGRVLRR